MEKGKRYIAVVIVYLIVLLIFLFLPTISGTQQAIYPNDLKLTREQFPLIYDFNLKEGINKIDLNQGINLEKVYNVEIQVQGCQDTDAQFPVSEKIIFNNKEVQVGLQSCQSLFYSDKGDEAEYQHYTTQTAKVTGILDTHTLNIDVKNTLATKVLGRTLKIYEYVDCTRDSQCPLIRVGDQLREPLCDVNYHQCSLSPKEISSIGTLPNKVTEGVAVTKISLVQYILIAIFGSAVITFGIWYFFMSMKK